MPQQQASGGGGLLGQLGGIIVPFMVGKVKDLTGSATYGLYAVAAGCFVAFVLIAWGLPKRLYFKG